MTQASLLIVLLVGTAVGAVTGLFVGNALGSLSLAILAGFLGIIAGVLVRNFLVARAAGMGPDDTRTPIVVIVFGRVASLTLAGLLASLLMAMLMITYYTHPGETPKLRSRR
jgi:hypothetical protein